MGLLEVVVAGLLAEVVANRCNSGGGATGGGCGSWGRWWAWGRLREVVVVVVVGGCMVRCGCGWVRVGGGGFSRGCMVRCGCGRCGRGRVR